MLDGNRPQAIHPKTHPRILLTWCSLGNFYCCMPVFLSLTKVPSSVLLCLCCTILKWASQSDRLGQGSRSVSTADRFLILSETPVVFFCSGLVFFSFVHCKVTAKHWGLSLAMCHMPNTFEIVHTSIAQERSVSRNHTAVINSICLCVCP